MLYTLIVPSAFLTSGGIRNCKALFMSPWPLTSISFWPSLSVPMVPFTVSAITMTISVTMAVPFPIAFTVSATMPVTMTMIMTISMTTPVVSIPIAMGPLFWRRARVRVWNWDQGACAAEAAHFGARAEGRGRHGVKQGRGRWRVSQVGSVRPLWCSWRQRT